MIRDPTAVAAPATPTPRLILAFSMCRPDLVEERQRACVALERGSDEFTQRRLGLTLDIRCQAQLRDRLDVEALIGLEELERLQRDPRPVVSGPGTALAQDAAQWRDPAEALLGLEHAVAFDAAVDLGSLAKL